MTIPMSEAPSLIALDWGTTSLRAYALGPEGQVLESRAEPWGVMNVPNGDFPAAFHTAVGAWRARWPALNAIACGMVGSTQGWTEVAYQRCPAGIAELAANLTPVHDAALHIISGLAKFGDTPDMMRGEETQVVGALELRPDLASSSVVVLPGTHSKWVRITRGDVVDFTTFLTGELFAVLRDHSILGRFAQANPIPSDRRSPEAAFARGVLAARAAATGVAPLLFSARSTVLASQLEPDASLDYLSGLLIGDEVRCGLAAGAHPAALIGDPMLCARYVLALQLFDISPVPVVDGAAARGLWEIARRAGLLA